MERVPPALSLLDELARRVGCAYLSDLRFLDAAGRRALAEEIGKISAESAALRDWNDALVYLTGRPPAESAERAKDSLLRGLYGQRRRTNGR